MNVVKFKGCRRCGGDLFLERDPDGINITCLQCGTSYLKPVDPPITIKSKSGKIFAH